MWVPSRGPQPAAENGPREGAQRQWNRGAHGAPRENSRRPTRGLCCGRLQWESCGCSINKLTWSRDYGTMRGECRAHKGAPACATVENSGHEAAAVAQGDGNGKGGAPVPRIGTGGSKPQRRGKPEISGSGKRAPGSAESAWRRGEGPCVEREAAGDSPGAWAACTPAEAPCSSFHAACAMAVSYWRK